MTITISKDSEISVGGVSASVENLAVDDIISFAVDSDTVKFITVINEQLN